MKKIHTCLLATLGMTATCGQAQKTDAYEVDEFLTKVAKLIRPKVLFPYHYGETDLTSIPAQLSEDGIDVRIRHYE